MKLSIGAYAEGTPCPLALVSRRREGLIVCLRQHLNSLRSDIDAAFSRRRRASQRLRANLRSGARESPLRETKGEGSNLGSPVKCLWTVCFLPLLIGFFACRFDPRVIISTKGGKEITVRVEIADTPAERALGLQYRRQLGDGQGMLFLFSAEKAQSFWMKNTPLSLDIIFIDGQRKIVGIIHKTVPFSTASLSVSAPSRFVLEIKGGLSRREGIAVGDPVRFEGIFLEGVKE